MQTKAMKDGIENEELIISQYVEKMEKMVMKDWKFNHVDFLFLKPMGF